MNNEYIPTVVQVQPQENYKVNVFFSDGKIVLFDVSSFIGKGVFSILSDKNFFFERCTVLNNTLAWDISGRYDNSNCIDIAPETIYNN